MGKTAGQRASIKQEKRIVGTLSSIAETRRQVGSGNQWFAKGDVVADKLHVECKTRATACKSITLKQEYYSKLNNECPLHKTPALVFSFGGSSEDYISMRVEDFIKIVKEGL